MRTLPRWFAKRVSTDQSSWASAGVHGTFPAWCPRCVSPVTLLGSNVILLREPRIVRLKPATTCELGAVLLEDEALTACVAAIINFSQATLSR